MVFTLIFTDFGVPKVIGGNFNMLAVDIYKQVIGQQNFQMGAVVSIILLIPAVIAFSVDRIVQKKQVALLSARAVPYEPKPNRRDRHGGMLAFCSLVALLILCHDRHGPVRRPHHLLALQPRAHLRQLRLRSRQRRRLGFLFQLDPHVASTPPSWAPRSSSSAPIWWRRAGASWSGATPSTPSP